MKLKSLYEQYVEEFSASDEKYCAYCLVINGGNGCDCGQHAWRHFSELDENSQKQIINEKLSIPFGEKL